MQCSNVILPGTIDYDILEKNIYLIILQRSVEIFVCYIKCGKSSNKHQPSYKQLSL